MSQPDSLEVTDGPSNWLWDQCGVDRYGPVWTCRTPVGPTAGGRQPLEEDHVFLVLLAGEAVGRGHALALAVAGAKCTHCLGDGDPGAKPRLAKLAGALFAVAGLLFALPVCWTAYAVVRDFYDPDVAAPLKRELGPALYLGWGASLLLLVGGGLLHAGSSPPGAGARGPTLGRAGKEGPQPVAAGGTPAEKAYV